MNYEFPICKHRNPPGEGLTSGVVTITGVPDLSCHACALERRDEQIRVLREAAQNLVSVLEDIGSPRNHAIRKMKDALAATQPGKGEGER